METIISRRIQPVSRSSDRLKSCILYCCMPPRIFTGFPERFDLEKKPCCAVSFLCGKTKMESKSDVSAKYF